MSRLMAAVSAVLFLTFAVACWVIIPWEGSIIIVPGVACVWAAVWRWC